MNDSVVNIKSIIHVNKTNTISEKDIIRTSYKRDVR